MKTLNERILFDGKPYPEVKDDDAKELIKEVTDKLSSLKNEIESDPKGYIEISTSGVTYCFAFADELAAKITEVLQA